MRILCIWFIFILPVTLSAQQGPLALNLEKALEMASDNYIPVRLAHFEIKLAGRESIALPDFPSAELLYQSGQLYAPQRDYNFEIMQSFGSAPSYIVRRRIGSKRLEKKELILEMSLGELQMKLKHHWFTWQYLDELEELKEGLLFYFTGKERIAELRFKAGETGSVELITIRTEAGQAKNELFDIRAEKEKVMRSIRYLLSYDDEILIESLPLEIFLLGHAETGAEKFQGDNMQTGFAGLQADIADLNNSLAKSMLFPEISAGYFQRSIGGNDGFRGWQVSLGIPLWFFPGREKVQKSEIISEISKNELEYIRGEQKMIIEELFTKLNHQYDRIMYYRSEALANADILEKTVTKQYETEDIEYYRLVDIMSDVYLIRKKYLDILNEYNQNMIRLEYYLK